MKKLWEWLSGNVIKEVGEVLDELITTDEERLNAKERIVQILEKADTEAQKEVSERWKYDMQSDSFLSKKLQRKINKINYLCIITLIKLKWNI